MRKLSELVQNISEGRSGAHAFIIEGKAGETRDAFITDLLKELGCTEIDSVFMNMSGKTGYLKDDVIPFMERLSMSPYGRYLAGVINDAELLGEILQNKLLKTLEEPPEYAVIILIADGVANFLPTVLSRCVVLQMRAVEEAQIAAFLERRQNIAPEQSQVLARFAGGNPGKALQLTEDQAFMELRDRAVDFLAHISSADVMQISEFASGVDQARRDDLLELVLMWYRDILLYHSTRDSNHLIFQEDLQYIIEAADTLSYEQLGAIIDQTDLASRRLKSNVAADAVLEMMFLNIRGQYRNRG